MIEEYSRARRDLYGTTLCRTPLQPNMVMSEIVFDECSKTWKFSWSIEVFSSP